jgi:hypothetical protein
VISCLFDPHAKAKVLHANRAYFCHFGMDSTANPSRPKRPDDQRIIS